MNCFEIGFVFTIVTAIEGRIRYVHLKGVRINTETETALNWGHCISLLEL